MSEPLRVPMEQVPACRVVLLRLAQRFEARARPMAYSSAGVLRRRHWLDAAEMAHEMAEEIVREARR